MDVGTSKIGPRRSTSDHTTTSVIKQDTYRLGHTAQTCHTRLINERQVQVLEAQTKVLVVHTLNRYLPAPLPYQSQVFPVVGVLLASPSHNFKTVQDIIC